MATSNTIMFSSFNLTPIPTSMQLIPMQTATVVSTADLLGKIVFTCTRNGYKHICSIKPDGNWMVFASSRDGDHEIYIMRTDGSNLHQLTFNAKDDWQPRWDP